MPATDRSNWSFADELEALLPELRAFARRLCRDDTLADDMTQSACLKAWANVDTFKTGSLMRPWLFRILRNEYYQYSRRSWRDEAVPSETIEETLSVADPSEQSMQASQLSDAIYHLPDGQRDALILVLAVGMTYQEAAEVLGCSAGTVKSRVSRARADLATDMSGNKSIRQSRDKTQNSGVQRLFDHADALIEEAKDRAGVKPAAA